MGEARYLSVIHGQTGEIVSAYKFENDATWIGRDKDELFATPIYCKSNEKVKMIFIKTYPKQNGKIVHGYFRSMPGESNLLNEPSGESDSHRRAKENIYSRIYSGNIKIDGKVLDKELIDDIKIEYRIDEYEYVIPDVVVLFKDIHPKYGLGIFFEIQLSNQTQEKTNERDYQRVIKGFSGVWLYKNNFLEDMKFDGDNINIESHKQLMLKLEKEMESNFIKKINRYGKIIDNKIIEFKSTINKYQNENEKQIKEDILILKSTVDNALDVCNDSVEHILNVRNSNVEYIKSKSYEIINNEINPLVKKCINELQNNKNNLDDSYSRWANLNIEDIDKNIKDKLSEIYDKHLGKFYEEISDIIKNTKIDLENDKNNILSEIKNIDIKSLIIKKKCPKCNKDMKIGKAMAGHNWYCEDFPYCDGFIEGGKL